VSAVLTVHDGVDDLGDASQFTYSLKFDKNPKFALTHRVAPSTKH
jgi:hypothetical protein